MRASVVISALIAVLVGFGSTIPIVLAAAAAVGADRAQSSSWVAALCLSMAVLTTYLSVRHRMPIVTAWSTPGLALIAATHGDSFPSAVGAFFLAGALIVLTAAFKPLAALIARIPTSIASAMLAGVLLSFVLAVFDHLHEAPHLVVPMLVVFVLIRLVSPIWAVLAALFGGIALAYLLGMTKPIEALHLSRFVWITPAFDPAVLLGLGVPLYLVTMASQNLPGFAVLKAAGYEPPTRSILASTGLASVATAGLGAHTSNLAAITASICTGPDAHPDKDKRWLTGPVYAAFYAVLALFGASVVTLFASFPEALVVTVASVALIGPLASAMSAAMADEQDRFAAIATFAVTASTLTAFGIGSAFWGLAAGLLVYGLETVWRWRKG